MTREEVFVKLQEIFVDLLDDDTFELTEEASMETVEDWDSLLHITLVAAVEDEFKISLSTDDIIDAKNVNALTDIILRELDKK